MLMLSRFIDDQPWLIFVKLVQGMVCTFVAVYFFLATK
jgi:hypothetical protein